MIGFFDSGLGGLSILKEVVKRFPEYSYIYLGDNKEAPYGGKSLEEIYALTLKGVDYLFKEGAQLIILACNTASSGALRRIQKEYLTRKYPQRKVLGVIFPTVESFLGNFEERTVGILATQATVESQVYPKEFLKFDNGIKVYQQAAPLLVPLIESGQVFSKEGEQVVKDYLSKLLSQSSQIKTVILGCTHYLLIKNIFQKLVLPDIKFFCQDQVVADKLGDYLERHSEIETRLARGKKVFFRTTGDKKSFDGLAQLFYEEEVFSVQVDL
jgi:glutamate racemase